MGWICIDMDDIQFRMADYQNGWKKEKKKERGKVSENPMRFCLCCEWELMEWKHVKEREECGEEKNGNNLKKESQSSSNFNRIWPSHHSSHLHQISPSNTSK